MGPNDSPEFPDKYSYLKCLQMNALLPKRCHLNLGRLALGAAGQTECVNSLHKFEPILTEFVPGWH